MKSVLTKFTSLAGVGFLAANFFAATQAYGQQPAPPPANQNNAVQEAVKNQLPNLVSHPLAGEKVQITVYVKDALGQEGHSQQVEVLLPKPDFRNPINPSLAQLRKTLALDSRKAPEVAAALDRLIRERAANIPNPASLQALKDIQRSMADVKDPVKEAATLDKDVSDMWTVMMQLEEDHMTKAEKQLRDAEKALREALQKETTPEELRQRMEEARKAIEQALKEKSEQAKDPQAQKDYEKIRQMMDEMR
jgi:hypothetical protein